MSGSIKSSQFPNALIARVIGIISSISGLLVFLGWQLNLPPLETFRLGAATMKPNLGILFFMGGIILILLQSDKSLFRWISRILSALIILLAFLTFVEFIFSVNLGIDQLFIHVKSINTPIIFPARMAANAALNFFLLGVIFYHLSSCKKLNINFIEILIVIVCTISTIGLISFVFGYKPINDTTGYYRLATNATVLFILLSYGIFLTARKDHRKKASVEQKFLAGITVIAVLIGFISVLSISNIRSWENIFDLRQKNQKVKDVIRGINNDVLLVETGTSNYILNGDTVSLSQIREAKSDMPGLLTRLGILSSQNIFPQYKLNNLSLLIERQIKYADQVIKTRNSGRFDHIKTIADFHQLHLISNKIRSQLDHLLDIENQQINTGHIRLDKQSAKVRFLTKMGLLFLTILLILHYVFMMNDTAKRKKAESELVKLNEELEDRIERRTKALQESREQYRLMIESVRDYALFMLDTDGFITNWNRGAEHTYGYKPDEIIGNQFSIFFTPEDVNDGKPAYELKTAKKNGRVEMDGQRVRKDGSLFWVNSVLTAIWDENENLKGYAKVTRDVTEQKKAEEKIRNININLEKQVAHRTELLSDTNKKLQEEEAKLRLVVESAPNGIVMVDSKGIVRMVNIQAENYFGYHRDEMLGKPIEILVPDYIRKDHVSIRKNYMANPVTMNLGERTDLTARKKDGTIFPVDVALSPIALHSEIHVLVSIVDISKRKATENEIKSAKEDAVRANLAKSEFLSRMSHELRTPMNSILGFAQLMNMGELAANHKKGVSHILKNGKHLLELINEVLDLARIESGKLSISIEPINLTGIVSETLDIVQPLADQQNIKLNSDDCFNQKLFVQADQQKLKQILLNLLNNAIKYNRDKGSVKISCLPLNCKSAGESRKKAKGQVEMVRISIADTGRGIATKDIKNLFDPFRRIGENAEEIEGTGLGLTVAKKLVEAMKGTIGVESKIKEGSTFWIDLPKATDQNQHYEQSKKRTKTKSEKTQVKGSLLYIEDNISNTQLIEQIIENHRPSIHMISDIFGKNTVKLAHDYMPSLILLDLDLPDIKGDKVLQQLQNDEKTKSIPVVILSADAIPKNIKRLINSGAKDYLTKPLDVEQFLKVLDEFMSDKK